MSSKPAIKILLVDDREDNLLSIESIFNNTEYEFRKATSGRQALKILLKEQDFTLILMDVNMPDLNGVETAAMIYEWDKLKHVPIIFITAYNYGEANIYRAYQAGAVDFIYKPINPELLKAKVSVFVELYKKNHQLREQEQKLISINKNLEKEIQERKLSEQKVNVLNEKLLQNIHNLEASNTELARFAYVASHDLQEPLRKIRTFGDRFLEKYRQIIDKEGLDYIERMQRASKRMQLLIDDILSFSKVSFNKGAFVPTNFNVLINEILADLEILIEQKKASINIESLPEYMVIPGLIRQLFQNLISNSLKFNRRDVLPEIHIFSGGTQTMEGKTYSTIIVRDNGIGFEQKYAEQIFGMFQRLHGNGEYEGTGIGLAICKKIMDHHGGMIKASSKLDEGSVFTLFLPTSLQNTSSNVGQDLKNTYC
jgi:signal transduction histidine kinase